MAIFHARAAATGANDGSSWDDAFVTLASAAPGQMDYTLAIVRKLLAAGGK